MKSQLSARAATTAYHTNLRTYVTYVRTSRLRRVILHLSSRQSSNLEQEPWQERRRITQEKMTTNNIPQRKRGRRKGSRSPAPPAAKAATLLALLLHRPDAFAEGFVISTTALGMTAVAEAPVALQKHPHFHYHNSDMRSMPLSPKASSAWENIVPKADLVGTLFGGAASNAHRCFAQVWCVSRSTAFNRINRASSARSESDCVKSRRRGQQQGVSTSARTSLLPQKNVTHVQISDLNLDHMTVPP